MVIPRIFLVETQQIVMPLNVKARLLDSLLLEVVIAWHIYDINVTCNL